MKTVLFVCVHNAGRSQMAAGFMQTLGAGKVEVLSAGSAPKDSINPVAAQAMAEVGIDSLLYTETVGLHCIISAGTYSGLRGCKWRLHCVFVAGRCKCWQRRLWSGLCLFDGSDRTVGTKLYVFFWQHIESCAAFNKWCNDLGTVSAVSSVKL